MNEYRNGNIMQYKFTRWVYVTCEENSVNKLKNAHINCSHEIGVALDNVYRKSST